MKTAVLSSVSCGAWAERGRGRRPPGAAVPRTSAGGAGLDLTRGHLRTWKSAGRAGVLPGHCGGCSWPGNGGRRAGRSERRRLRRKVKDDAFGEARYFLRTSSFKTALRGCPKGGAKRPGGLGVQPPVAPFGPLRAPYRSQNWLYAISQKWLGKHA